ncbi:MULTISPECIES: hypothetical protein [unclassified Nocardioides]|uniref:hypothetical protein n=1 Tax=Nocardioides sp. URHA0032 TaxID=1380388 RepID=UPI000687B3E3|nr:hypothetical protein [Nocardioides sp. URHA0032]
MFSKSSLLVGFAAGYVLGSRAGRERYEQIKSGATRLAGNPTVQSAASKAQETVATQAPAVAGAVKEKATSAASAVADKVHRDGGDHLGDPSTMGTSTARS